MSKCPRKVLSSAESRAEVSDMADEQTVQELWETAVRSNDLVGAFTVMLSVQPDLTLKGVHDAMLCLAPHVEPGARPSLGRQIAELSAVIPEAEDDPDLEALFSWSAPKRSFAIDDQVNSMPSVLADALGALYSADEEREAQALSDFDRVAAAFTEQNTHAGTQWYLRVLAAPGSLLAKVAQIPEWMAAVHTPLELTLITKALSNCLHPAAAYAT